MKERGFSLLEIIIGFALVTVALLVMIGVFTSAVKLIGKGQELQTASEMAREQMEMVRARAQTIPDDDAMFDGRQGDPPTGVDFPPAPYPGRSVDGIDYKVTVDVALQDADLARVTVKVYWDDEMAATVETLVQP